MAASACRTWTRQSIGTKKYLALKWKKKFRIEPAKANVAMIRNGDLRFELFEVEGADALPDDRRVPDRDIRTHGNKHVAFRVNDLDEWLKYLERKGADIAFVVKEDFGKGCFIRDCAGNLIEFVEEPNP